MSEKIIDIIKKIYPTKNFIYFVDKKGHIRIEVSKEDAGRPQRTVIGKKIIDKISSLKQYEVTTINDDGREFVVAQDKVKTKVSIKPAGSQQSPFVPSQIVIGGKKIVNEWLTLDEFISITKRYISKMDISKEDKAAITSMVDDCTNSSYTIKYSGNKKLVPAEFYEVLSAIKLASILLRNDKKAFKILGLPQKTKVTTAHVYIPQASNYPLTDYEVSVNGAHEQSRKKNERSTHKISVKSKVSSAKTNTVKFSDVFESSAEAKKWMDGYGKAQEVQGTIALSGVSYPSRRKTYYPVDAIGKVIDKMNSTLDAPTKKALKKVSKIVYNVTDPEKNIIASDYDMTEDEDKALRKFIKNYVTPRAGTTKTPYNMINVVVACEKYFESESRKTSNNSKLNFYQMFYDNILKKKNIAYSIAKLSGSTIVFNYYTAINWEAEYNNWIALRSKNSADTLKDTMGLDV